MSYTAFPVRGSRIGTALQKHDERGDIGQGADGGANEARGGDMGGKRASRLRAEE